MPEQFVVVGVSPRATCENLAVRPMKVFGAILVIFGILSFLFAIMFVAIAASVSSEPQYLSGSGVLFAIMFILSGSFGISSSLNKLQCQVVTCLVLSVISAIMAVSYLLASIFMLAVYVNQAKVIVGLSSVNFLMALVASIATIAQSALCCRSVCCGARNNPNIPVQYAYQPQPSTFQAPGYQTGGYEPKGNPSAPPYNQ